MEVQTDFSNCTQSMIIFECSHKGNDVMTQANLPYEYIWPSVKTTARGPDKRTCYFEGYNSILSGGEKACNDLCGVSQQVLALLISIFNMGNTIGIQPKPTSTRRIIL